MRSLSVLFTLFLAFATPARADIYDQIRSAFTKPDRPQVIADAVASDGSLVPAGKQIMLFLNGVSHGDKAKIVEFNQIVAGMRALYPERETIVIDTEGQYVYVNPLIDYFGKTGEKFEGRVITHLYMQESSYFHVRDKGQLELSSLFFHEGYSAPVAELASQEPLSEPASQFERRGLRMLRGHMARGAQVAISFPRAISESLLLTDPTERAKSFRLTTDLVGKFFRSALDLREAVIYLRTPLLTFTQGIIGGGAAYLGTLAGVTYFQSSIQQLAGGGHIGEAALGAAYYLPYYLMDGARKALPTQNTMFAVQDGKITDSSWLPYGRFREAFGTSRSLCDSELTPVTR